MEQLIIVLAAKSQDQLENYGADVEAYGLPTMKEAIARAKYYLTEEYRVNSEASEKLGYSQVVKNNIVMHDFFAKK